MARLIWHNKARLAGMILGAFLVTLSVHAADYSLASQGLSQSINDYSSINYQNTGQEKRELVYVQPSTGKKIVTLSEVNSQFKLLQSIPQVKPLFVSVKKQGNYQALKQIFVDQDDVEKQGELNNKLVQLDSEVSKLKQTLARAAETEKASINDDLADLAQQQRNLRKAIKASKRRQTSILNLAVYDLSQVFDQGQKKAFFLLDSSALYLVNPESTRGSYQDPLSGKNLTVSKISYQIESKVEFNRPTVLKKLDYSVLNTIYYQNTLMSFSYNQQTAVLSHIKDKRLLAFSNLLKTLPLEPDTLSFKGETLTTRYLWSTSGKQKTLEVAYKETGKRKNLIQVKASAQTNLFDPKQTSTAIEKHIGVLAVAKGQRLVELKKVQTINGKKDISWVQDIRNGIIKLGEETIFVSKEDYYGYEGLWYLASWMSTNNIKTKKIFLINGTEPISLTATLTSVGQVVISKAGNTLYQFSIDKNGFVNRLFFAPSKQTLSLISKDTKTTKSNKAKVKQYMQTNKIVLL